MIIKNVDAEYAMSQMVPVIEEILDKLNKEEQNEYILGMKTAYVETLELIQRWEMFALYGLDYNIVEKYPIVPVEQRRKLISFSRPLID